MPEGVETVTQPEPDGTGGAIRAALGVIESSETVLVLSGDVPLLSAEVMTELLESHVSSGAAATANYCLADPYAIRRKTICLLRSLSQVSRARAANLDIRHRGRRFGDRPAVL